MIHSPAFHLVLGPAMSELGKELLKKIMYVCVIWELSTAKRCSCESCFSVGPDKQSTALRNKIMTPISSILEIGMENWISISHPRNVSIC